MAKINYKNKMELVDESIGKLIICRHKDNVTLYGRVANVSFPENVDKKKMGQLLESYTYTFFDHSTGKSGTALDKLVGYHKDIVHDPLEGRPLGGCECAFANNTLYLRGHSGSFWGVYLEAVQRCVGEGIKVEDVGLVPLIDLSYEEWIKGRNAL